VTIASTAGALNLGDNVAGAPAGLDISNATFGEISTTGTVALYAGDPFGAARGDLTVGTLTVNGGSMSELLLLADAAHDVIFTGAVTSTGTTFANLVVGGMGTPGFIAAAQALPATAINVHLGAPTGPAPANGEVLLATQTATFLANGKIVQQNTSTDGGYAGLLVETPTGVTQSLFLGCSTCSSAPSVIDIFGSIDTPTGVAVTGPAMAISPQIVLLSPLEKSFQYRANGCIIADAGDCQPGDTLPILWIIDDLPPGSELDSIFATLPVPPPLLTPGDYQGQADVTIIGSGNEEIWRKPDGRHK
jgi:hypothetical protein